MQFWINFWLVSKKSFTKEANRTQTPVYLQKSCQPTEFWIRKKVYEFVKLREKPTKRCWVCVSCAIHATVGMECGEKWRSIQRVLCESTCTDMHRHAPTCIDMSMSCFCVRFSSTHISSYMPLAVELIQRICRNKAYISITRQMLKYFQNLW